MARPSPPAVPSTSPVNQTSSFPALQKGVLCAQCQGSLSSVPGSIFHCESWSRARPPGSPHPPDSASPGSVGAAQLPLWVSLSLLCVSVSFPPALPTSSGVSLCLSSLLFSECLPVCLSLETGNGLPTHPGSIGGRRAAVSLCPALPRTQLHRG